MFRGFSLNATLHTLIHVIIFVFHLLSFTFSFFEGASENRIFNELPLQFSNGFRYCYLESLRRVPFFSGYPDIFLQKVLLSIRSLLCCFI
jgi:hypothetical protein